MSINPRFSEAIAYLFPNEDTRKVVVRDGGDGPQLVEWGLTVAQPTSAEIDAALVAKDAASDAAKNRDSALKSDTARSDLLARLKAATPAQIDAYVEANVTTIAQVRTMFKAILKMIATDPR